jgi:uncharacterized protein YjeT (DUF2065 family)
MTDLWTALSLVAVIEGLMLFAFPASGVALRRKC